MTSYNDYLEDFVFCNDRSMTNQDNGWKSNGGNIRNMLQFNGSNGLSCSADTDSFSVDISKAKLKHPVGLITYNELNYIGNYELWTVNADFWTGTPGGVSLNPDGIISAVGNSRPVFGIGGSINANGLRPVISLTPWIQYESGNGSMNNPYVVSTN